ncbi:unnamed protein product [Paramecium octaurelia]|uniref:TLDc domain-containing protein n=1 Tax=Paramecium octaurelia TaxID=43137 RepID=A0A8S1WRZ9_PAROT|nr:unnamed protein product [Paramecium octaurelia]
MWFKKNILHFQYSREKDVSLKENMYIPKIEFRIISQVYMDISQNNSKMMRLRGRIIVLSFNIKIFFEHSFIQPKLLKDDFWVRLFFILQEKSKKTIKESQLIYLGSRDGLNKDQFLNRCNAKCNLLVYFSLKVDIFGGYSPYQWQQNPGDYVQVDTLSLFLFSQTHGQIYPLKQDSKYSIYCNSGYGPTFGSGHEIIITSDFKGGYSNLGYAYQWDKYQNKNSTHLFGQDTPNITKCK